MRLKRLQLQGYKTFATRTEFVFDEGVTAIVGPNGSGKSNVADAIRWVLGEQSYRMLRGSQTIDMIFAGSKARPRAGMAQAILTLDNSGGWLPIDFAEVEIGRRAYRSGDNEYLLNGQKVRLRDITELLATSGLAERTYTMIGQGLIDRALSIKSDERRALFEEAAGISHYKARRAESLRRLRDTQRNLERVGDILAEIKPRLNSLRRQANRARNYGLVAADLRELLRIWYGFQWENSRKQFQLLKQESSQAEQKWIASRDQLLKLQEAVGQERSGLRQVEEQLNGLQENRDSIREKLELATRQVAILNEREQMVSKQLAELATEVPRLTIQKNESSQDLAVALEGLGVAQATVVDAEYKLRAFNDDSAEQRKALAHWQKEVGRLAETDRSEQGQINQLEGRLVQLQERQREFNERSLANSEGTEDSPDVGSAETSLQAARDKLKAIRKERQAGRDELAKVQKELSKKRQESRELNNRLNKGAKELAGLEARAELLSERRQKALALPAGFSVAGRLAEGLTIPAEYQPAIEAALGLRLSTLLLDSSDSLWELLDHPSQDASLSLIVADKLPQRAAVPAPASGIIGRAADLITITKAMEPVANFLLADVFVVADSRVAYEIGLELPAGAIAVTQAGLIVEAGGLVLREPVGHSDSPLARETAYRTAMDLVGKAETAFAEQQQAVDRVQNELQTLQAEVDAFQPREREANQREQAANQKVSESQRALDRLRQQLAYQEKQRKNLAEESARLNKRVSDTEAQLGELRTRLEVTREHLATARTELENLPAAEMAQEQRNWQQQIDAAQTIVAGRQAVVDSRRAALNQVNSQLQRLESQQNELKQQQQRIDLKVAQEQERTLQTDLAAVREKMVPLREQRQQGQKQLQAAEEAVVEQQRQTHSLETAFTRAQVASGQHENLIEGLRERIKADVGLVALSGADDQAEQSPLPLEGIFEQLPSVEELPEDIEKNIQNYRAQMQRMGAINPDAPAEFEETETRYDFLTEQVEDLMTTEKQLREVIAELDELTSRAFAETVAKVNAIFGGTFSQLFGGGTAQLVLTEPDDLTVSGVDIVAQLPRRREQGLGLLSGGERSLTAAALIFSLLKVSPTPFCVMDEVDAMLDEANVTRFRDLLRELSLQTQFIVITHNRGTVQAAQTVYGISMGGDSVSQVISIKPEEYINAQEMI